MSYHNKRKRKSKRKTVQFSFPAVLLSDLLLGIVKLVITNVNAKESTPVTEDADFEVLDDQKQLPEPKQK